MRTGLDGATDTLYDSGEYDTHLRLKCQNGDDTYIALEYRYTKVQWSLPDPSTPVAKLNVDLIRELTETGDADSLNPLVSASSFNKLDDTVTYSPLLQLGRQVTLEVNLTAVGAARPVDGDLTWYEVFRGIIAKVSFPDHDKNIVSIQCHDLGARLQHQKSEAAYLYDAGTSIEATVTAILSNNGITGISTYFPVATGKLLTTTYDPGVQKTVWQQMRDLAQSMGWSVTFRYRGTGGPELTFFEPARGKVTPDLTVQVDDFKTLSVDESEVRNVGYIVFVDQSGSEQLVGPDEDAASITKYGGALGIRRPFWIKLEDSSPVRLESEATAMLAAALSDVADPDVVAQASTVPLVFAEPGTDLYTLQGSTRFFDSDQDWAVYSCQITFTVDKPPRSSLGVRGVPTAGMKSWRDLATRLPGPRPETPLLPTIEQHVGYWPMDNFDGDKLYDASGNERDSTIGTAVTTRVPGINGMAVNFPGSGSGHILLSDADADTIANEGWYSCWFRSETAAAASYGAVLSRGTQHFDFSVLQSGAFPQTVRMYLPGGAAYDHVGIIEQDVWHFLFVQWSVTGDFVEVYLGGLGTTELRLIRHIDTLTAFSTLSRVLGIGSIGSTPGMSTGFPFNGSIDDVRAGSGTLTLQQIRSLFQFPGSATQKKVTGSEVGDTLDITAKTLTADTGTIGGWTLAAGTLSAPGIILDSVNDLIRIGAAIDPLTGIGAFLGSDGTSDYDFRIGDPNGAYLHWDGSAGTLTIEGSIISSGNAIAASQLTAGNVVINLVPNAVATYDLGTNALQWRHTYTNAVRFVTGATDAGTAGHQTMWVDAGGVIKVKDGTGTTYTYSSGGLSTASLGLTTAGSDVRVNYAGGANGLFDSANQNAPTVVAGDKLLIGDVSLSNQAESVQISTIDLGLFANSLVGYTTNAGTVTSVSTGAGLDVATGTTTPNITLNLNEIALGGAPVGGADHLVYVDAGVNAKLLFNQVPLSAFLDDLGYTNVTAGTGITVSSGVVSVDYVGADNYINAGSGSTIIRTDRIPFSDQSVGSGTVGYVTPAQLFATLVAADIPNLSANQITADTFDAARIPSLPASKITAGTFPTGTFRFDQHVTIDEKLTVGATTIGASLTTGDILTANGVFATSDGGAANVDHLWHDDTGNAWHFCSDTTRKATGNSSMVGARVIVGVGSLSVPSVQLGSASDGFALIGGKIAFIVDGVVRASLDTSGNFVAEGDIEQDGAA